MVFIRSVALAAFLATADAHGYLSKPVSRNALGKSGLGSPSCSWGGSPFPCNGDFMSLGGTSGPDSTGCSASGKAGLDDPESPWGFPWDSFSSSGSL